MVICERGFEIKISTAVLVFSSIEMSFIWLFWHPYLHASRLFLCLRFAKLTFTCHFNFVTIAIDLGTGVVQKYIHAFILITHPIIYAWSSKWYVNTDQTIEMCPKWYFTLPGISGRIIQDFEKLKIGINCERRRYFLGTFCPFVRFYILVKKIFVTVWNLFFWLSRGAFKRSTSL